MQEHGSFEIKVINQTIIIKAFGAWNYETALSFGKEYKQLICKLKSKPWASLGDLTEWELFTPEALNHVGKLNEWANINNQKYEAIICSLSIQKELLKKSHEILTNVETRFFDDSEQAYKWLETIRVIKPSNRP